MRSPKSFVGKGNGRSGQERMGLGSPRRGPELLKKQAVSASAKRVPEQESHVAAGPEDGDDSALEKGIYKFFRKEADRCYEVARGFHKLRKIADKKLNHDAVKYYSSQNERFRLKGHAANLLASKIAFDYLNFGKNMVHVVDLHYQHEKEALHIVKGLLYFIIRIPSISKLLLITGHGMNRSGNANVDKDEKKEGESTKKEYPSESGNSDKNDEKNEGENTQKDYCLSKKQQKIQGLIKKAVLKLLNDEGISGEVDTRNPGLIIIKFSEKDMLKRFGFLMEGGTHRHISPRFSM